MSDPASPAPAGPAATASAAAAPAAAACPPSGPHPLRTIAAALAIGVAASLAAARFMRSYEFVPGHLFASYVSPLEGHEATAPQGPSETRAGWDPPARSLVLFLADGLRPDMVTKEAMPWTWRLIEERGAFVTARHAPPTFTWPGVAAILTGAPPVVTGVTFNVHDRPVKMDDVLSRARRGGMATRLLGDRSIAGWLPKLFPDALDKVGLYDDASAVQVTRRIRLGEVERAVLVVYLNDADDFAHRYGPESKKYKNAVRLAVDIECRNMFQTSDLDRDAFVLLSDHGHRAGGGHGGHEPEVERVPVVMAGAGVRHAGRVDGVRSIGGATSTIAALLGMRPPPAATEAAWTDLMSVPDATRAQIDAAERERIAALDRTLADVGLDAAVAVAVPERWTPDGPRAGSGALAAPGRLLLAGLLATALIAAAALALGVPTSLRALIPGALAVVVAGTFYIGAGDRATFSAINDPSTHPGELTAFCTRVVVAGVAAMLLALAAASPLARGQKSAQAMLAGHVIGPAAAALLLLPLGGPACPPRVHAAAAPFLLLLVLTAIAGLGSPLWFALWRLVLGPVEPQVAPVPAVSPAPPATPEVIG